MKTTNLILILMAIMSLMACKNQMHVVTLYVDTAEIEQSTIDQYANFGQPKGIANKDFTTYVRNGDMVIWNAVSISDPSDEVNITAIIDEPGADYLNKKYINFFDRTTLNADITRKGIVIGTIKNGKSGDVQKYGLKFTVKDKEGTFSIDPKMEMY